MTPHRSPRLTTIALIVLLALVPSFFTRGLHSGPTSVGPPTLGPTTIYKSEHRDQGSEAHLHAEVGFELILCLACFTSLRNHVLVAVTPASATLSELGAGAPTPPELLPTAVPALAFSSRAPPRA